jgi:hypothetical protein
MSSFQMYYGQLEAMVSTKLNGESREYLAGVDRDDYLDFLVAEFEWLPLIWDEGAMTVEPVIRKTARRHEFFHDRTYIADVDRFVLHVPVSPHPHRDLYFQHEPMHHWVGMPEPEWAFEGDVLLHEVDATTEAVQVGLEHIRYWLGNRNSDIEAGNANLRERIADVLDARLSDARDKSSATQELIRTLGIPLHRDASARAQPIPLKQRPLNIPKPRPAARPTAIEPELGRDELIAIVDFIEQYSRQFETAPETHAQLGEEGLRNLLLGMLNANFGGAATGETFSKLGKTDICLRVDAGNVLVTECKIWTGASGYSEAIDQLFRYVTWRHSYGVLLDFVDRKNLTHVVEEAKRATREHLSFTGAITDINPTRFTSRHRHPQDADKDIEIHHLFVDLSV